MSGFIHFRNVKLIVFALLAQFVIGSCTSPDESETCKLLSVEVQTLTYDNVPGSIAYNADFSGVSTFSYDNQGRIISQSGLPIRPNENSTMPVFYDHISAAISYIGDTIRVEDPFYFSNPINTVDFVIENDKLVHRKSRNFEPFSGVISYDYEYLEDIIIERNSGVVYRTFFLVNGNLSQVERIIKYGNVIAGKEVLEFSDYDNTPNLIRGKFFILGGFYKAFSSTNFQSFSRKMYSYENGEFFLNNVSQGTVSFGVDEQNNADLFNVECL